MKRKQKEYAIKNRWESKNKRYLIPINVDNEFHKEAKQLEILAFKSKHNEDSI